MARSSGTSRIRTLFNIGKKFVDILDDLWSTLRGSLPADLIKLLTPYILGGVGFITHLGEGMQAAKQAYRAFQDKRKNRQTKTRLVSAGLSTLIAGSGLGLSISLVASTLGLPVAASVITLSPALIPGLLMAIYILSLWRKSYVFHKAREKEVQARREYNEALAEWMKKPEYEPGAPEPQELHEKHARYEFLRERRLRAERKVAFNIVEVLASAMVVISTVIGTAAIIGASVASFGALPLALLIVGVTAGVACKVLEHFDKKYDYRFSRGVRSWCSNQWDRLRHFLTRTPAPQPSKTEVNSFLHRRLGEENLIQIEMVDLKNTRVEVGEPLEEKSSPRAAPTSPRVPPFSPELSSPDSSSRGLCSPRSDSAQSPPDPSLRSMSVH